MSERCGKNTHHQYDSPCNRPKGHDGGCVGPFSLFYDGHRPPGDVQSRRFWTTTDMEQHEILEAERRRKR